MKYNQNENLLMPQILTDVRSKTKKNEHPLLHVWLRLLREMKTL